MIFYIVSMLIFGLVIGALGRLLVPGHNPLGLFATALIGIVGALIGSWLLPQLGIHLGVGIVNAIIAATVGAVLLLVVLRLFRGRGRW